VKPEGGTGPVPPPVGNGTRRPKKGIGKILLACAQPKENQAPKTIEDQWRKGSTGRLWGKRSEGIETQRRAPEKTPIILDGEEKPNRVKKKMPSQKGRTFNIMHRPQTLGQSLMGQPKKGQ